MPLSVFKDLKMADPFKRILEKEVITASAPCRVDMGGTVDLSTFYYPLRHLSPCTFNMAIDLKTKVSLYPYADGKVKITSSGFRSAVYHLEKMPFAHPLGLMFAIVAYFNADGIHVVIDSASPPRSALGGSSVAAVALIAAFCKILKKVRKPVLSKMQMARLAQRLKQVLPVCRAGFRISSPLFTAGSMPGTGMAMFKNRNLSVRLYCESRVILSWSLICYWHTVGFPMNPRRSIAHGLINFYPANIVKIGGRLFIIPNDSSKLFRRKIFRVVPIPSIQRCA